MRTSRGRGARLALLLGLGAGLLAAGPAAASSPPTPGAPGIGDKLYPTLGNGGYDALHYDVDLRYATSDPAQPIDGTVTILARATQSLSRFDLDFGGDSVGRVSVDGRAARWSRSGDELVITPRSPLRDGRPFVVQVRDFTATPTEPDPDVLLSTAFFVTPDGSATAGQPDSTHAFLPSNDHPRDKASFTERFDVPAGTTAVGNGVQVAAWTRAGRSHTVFLQRQPMATELIQLAVGNYDRTPRGVHDGIIVRDLTPPSLTADLRPKLAQELPQLEWMQDRVGRYPFDAYGSFVVNTELGFALETQTLSLYDIPWFRDYDEGVWSPTMLHELSHMWFGDSVAPYEWSDVWLNEGHATWYELLWADEHGWVADDTGVDAATDLESFMKFVYAIQDQLRADERPARPAALGRRERRLQHQRLLRRRARPLRAAAGDRDAAVRAARARVGGAPPRRRRVVGRLQRARVADRRARSRPVPARVALRRHDARDAGPSGLDRRPRRRGGRPRGAGDPDAAGTAAPLAGPAGSLSARASPRCPPPVPPPRSASGRPARRAPRAPPAWPSRCRPCRTRSRPRGPSSCRAAR